jgi:hypothetical protein
MRTLISLLIGALALVAGCGDENDGGSGAGAADSTQDRLPYLSEFPE